MQQRHSRRNLEDRHRKQRVGMAEISVRRWPEVRLEAPLWPPRALGWAPQVLSRLGKLWDVPVRWYSIAHTYRWKERAFRRPDQYGLSVSPTSRVKIDSVSRQVFFWRRADENAWTRWLASSTRRRCDKRRRTSILDNKGPLRDSSRRYVIRFLSFSQDAGTAPQTSARFGNKDYCR